MVGFFAVGITKTAHGKTVSDIGAIYSSDSRDFVIMRIIDNDNFVLCSVNTASDGVYNFIEPTGDLIYQSNGNSTTNITGYTKYSIPNLYDFIIINNFNLFADGYKIEVDGSYKCDVFDIVEDYDILDLADVVNKIKDDRPPSGYVENIDFKTIDALKVGNVSMTYSYTKGGKCTIYFNMTTLKTIGVNFLGITQSSAIANPSKIYVPKSLPFDATNKVYSLTDATDYDAPTNAINLTSAYWETPLSPPDRVLQFKENGYGIQLGYITDKADGIIRKDILNTALILPNSRKLYPFAVSYSSSTLKDAYTNYSFIAFRNFCDLTNNDIRTNLDWVKNGDEYYIYLDYHSSGLDKIQPLKEWIGKSIEVLEKNDNTTLISKVVSSDILVFSESSSNDYGYIVLKLS